MEGLPKAESPEEQDPQKEAKEILITSVGGQESDSWDEIEKRYNAAATENTADIPQDVISIMREKAASERLTRG